VGRHSAFPFYTIGQRKGLGVFRPEPLYVTAIDAATNRIQSAGKQPVSYGTLARDVTMQKYASCSTPLRVVQQSVTG